MADRLSSKATGKPAGSAVEALQDDPVQPTVRDALIGALIGVVLIYAGWRIPYRIVSWSSISIGVLFVLVMTGFIVVASWERASPRVRRRLAGWRGHLRRDPQLGVLTRNVAGGYWQSAITVNDHQVDVVIEGGEEPVEALVHEARALIGTFQTLDARVRAYLASERASGQWEDAELEAEIGALRISALNFRWPARPDRVEIEFTGPDEGRFWCCMYRKGRLSGLRFDS